MGFPPAEERGQTIAATGITDIFGNGLKAQQLLHLSAMEEASQDSLFIILSDVQLDNPLVCSTYVCIIVVLSLTIPIALKYAILKLLHCFVYYE